jgi:hypothetical protein
MKKNSTSHVDDLSGTLFFWQWRDVMEKSSIYGGVPLPRLINGKFLRFQKKIMMLKKNVPKLIQQSMLLEYIQYIRTSLILKVHIRTSIILVFEPQESTIRRVNGISQRIVGGHMGQVSCGRSTSCGQYEPP